MTREDREQELRKAYNDALAKRAAAKPNPNNLMDLSEIMDAIEEAAKAKQAWLSFRRGDSD